MEYLIKNVYHKTYLQIRIMFSQNIKKAVLMFHDCDGDHEHSVHRVLVTMATALALEE